MSRLLSDDLKKVLPKLREQEHSKDPTVYAVFYFPGSGWKWFVTEGQPTVEDFLFFGYVIGFEAEFGYFSLNELEGVDIHGVKVEQRASFKPTTLEECLSVSI